MVIQMGRLWQCDWCGAIWDQREGVALVDMEFQGEESKTFACPDHLPPGHFPAADGEPLPDIDPVVSGPEAVDLGLFHD